MNMKFTFLAATLTCALTSFAMAQTNRVAYVDINRVTEKSEKINKAMGSVSNRVEDIQKEIEDKRKRLVDVKAEIKKGEGVLADSELKKKRDESSKLEKDLVDLEYEGRLELQKLDSNLLEPMIKTIVLAIQDVAQEKNIDLVLRGEAVIYGADAADITDDVVKKLNSAKYNSDGKSSTRNSDSSESSSSENKSSSSSANDSSESKETSGSSESSQSGSSSDENDSKSESANNNDGNSASNKSIIPSIPLRTRPVDRQQD